MRVDKTLSELWHLRGNTDVVSFEELREEASNTAFMAINAIKNLQEENKRLEEEVTKLKSVISDSWGKSLYGEINKLKENEKILDNLLEKFGRLTALYIKAVEGDRDFTDFYNHMAEIVYPNGRINEFNG